MKILAISDIDDESASGFADIGIVYIRFEAKKGSKTQIKARFEKERYGNLEHFSEIIGKFDPDTIFWKEPFEVNDELTYETCVKAVRQRKI